MEGVRGWSGVGAAWKVLEWLGNSVGVVWRVLECWSGVWRVLD